MIRGAAIPWVLLAVVLFAGTVAVLLEPVFPGPVAELRRRVGELAARCGRRVAAEWRREDDALPKDWTL